MGQLLWADEHSLGGGGGPGRGGRGQGRAGIKRDRMSRTREGVGQMEEEREGSRAELESELEAGEVGWECHWGQVGDPPEDALNLDAHLRRQTGLFLTPIPQKSTPMSDSPPCEFASSSSSISQGPPSTRSSSLPAPAGHGNKSRPSFHPIFGNRRYWLRFLVATFHLSRPPARGNFPNLPSLAK